MKTNKPKTVRLLPFEYLQKIGRTKKARARRVSRVYHELAKSRAPLIIYREYTECKVKKIAVSISVDSPDSNTTTKWHLCVPKNWTIPCKLK